VPRAVKILAADASAAPAVDTLILNAEDRRNPRAVAQGERGLRVEFDFHDAIALRTDDRLQLDTGEVVDIVAAPEALIEVRADLATLARIAWALGDRHIPVQFLSARFRLRRDDAIAGLVATLGGKITDIEAPFEPEGGAYAAAHPHDGHGHHHHHDHDHGHPGHHHHDKARHRHE
jgi:urease accessory protein